MKSQRYRLLLVAVYLLSLAGIIIGIRQAGWSPTWSTVFVYPEEPGFIDLHSIQAALDAQRQGLDPQQLNPGDRDARVMDYPRVWLSIGSAFHFEQESSLQAFGFLLAGLFACTGICLLWFFPSLWMLLALLSPASLMAMERGNNDQLMLVLVFLFALAGSRLVALLPALLAFLLKVYPVAVFASLWMRGERKLLLAALPLLAVILMLLYSQLSHIHGGITHGHLLSYGLPHWFNLFDSYLPGPVAPVIFVIVTIVLLAACWQLHSKHHNFEQQWQSLPARLFLAGACVYVFTYLLASNWDYRLIFLNLCVPFLVQHAWKGRVILLLSVVLAMSYLLLDHSLGKAGVLLNLLAKYLLFIDMLALLAALAWRQWRPA